MCVIGLRFESVKILLYFELLQRNFVKHIGV